MNHKKKMIRYWLPLAVYCLLIVVQSSLPIPTPKMYSADKFLHFIVYCILGVLLFRAFVTLPTGSNTLLTTLMTVFVSGLIAFGDEIHQIFVPSRTVDRADVLFDLIGTAAGIALYLLLRRYRRYLAANRS